MNDSMCWVSMDEIAWNMFGEATAGCSHKRQMALVKVGGWNMWSIYVLCPGPTLRLYFLFSFPTRIFLSLTWPNTASLCNRLMANCRPWVVAVAYPKDVRNKCPSHLQNPMSLTWPGAITFFLHNSFPAVVVLVDVNLFASKTTTTTSCSWDLIITEIISTHATGSLTPITITAPIPIVSSSNIHHNLHHFYYRPINNRHLLILSHVIHLESRTYQKRRKRAKRISMFEMWTSLQTKKRMQSSLVMNK